MEASWNIHRFNAQCRFWSEVAPPLNMVMAAYCGWKPKLKPSADVYGAEDFANYLSQFPGGERVKPEA